MSCFRRKHLLLRCRTALLGRHVQHEIRKRLLCSQINEQAVPSFDTILSQRRKESSASVLVEVENRHKTAELCNECSLYGKIQKAYYYTDNSHKCQVLIEFSSSDEALELLQKCGHLSSDGFPMRSRLLKFVPKNRTRATKKSLSVDIETSSNITPQAQGTKLVQSNTIDEQMVHFYETEKLSDLETRLGFIVCKQVEEFIVGLYPKGQVLPFGSLVNGFGRHYCDIDMVYCVSEATEPSGNLYFQEKNQVINDRTLVQRLLETLGDLLHYVVPGVSEVQRILRARVPIVKFQHNIVGRECDLTLSNMSGVHMSRLLYTCTQLAPALCPLLFTARSWAMAQGVTSKVPGTWITNFQLTLLAIFHLQQCGLLPSLRDLEEKKRLKAWQKSRVLDGKDEALEDLLKSFYEFYASFNFKSKGIAPYSGQILEKPEYTAMYIQNPLDRQLNASRNVGLSDLKKLQSRMADALTLMDNAPRKITIEKPWGIMALFTATTAAAKRQQEAMHKRFQVHELFHEGKEAGENYVVEATASGIKTAS
ncbi:poly(A) RNA polymerase, mitochondrial-like isoform X1 [Amblyomma americanum]|uniref:Poly(A) RNA polymerase mitochondrial-like central palm domain-containing protein n=1 Tax=Amblyomma americanum TaxID=6943 RepID=A0AAQ4F4X2_AMBAM